MAEPSKKEKVSLQEAVEQLSTSSDTHATEIRAVREKIEQIEPSMTTTLGAIEAQTKLAVKALEENMEKVLALQASNFEKISQKVKNMHDEVTEIVQALQPKSDNETSTPNTTQEPTPAPPIRMSNDQTLGNLTYLRPAMTLPSTIVVPPVSSFPTFAGKSTDRPRQFLLRVVEYAQTVNKWSKETLLRGISQFLKDSAFEWYCQLHITNNVPTTWDQFTTRFLEQFHSPIRIAQQEYEWDECKQSDNETINEFIVRLRSLWLEQKPKETEDEFIKHLFCKMRTDMLTLMSANRVSTLTEIIAEAQQVEEILYLRNKEARRRANQRTKPTTSTPWLALNTPTQASSRNTQPTTTTSGTQPSANTSFTPTCWRCYEPGHYSTSCPLNESRRTFEVTDNYQQPYNQRPKNN